MASCQIDKCDAALSACGEAVTAARDALKAKDKEMSLCRLAVNQSVSQSGQLDGELAEANGKLQSPLRNPFIMATVGVVLGLVVGAFALRK